MATVHSDSITVSFDMATEVSDLPTVSPSIKSASLSSDLLCPFTGLIKFATFSMLSE
jgi:hypothetical protein